MRSLLRSGLVLVFVCCACGICRAEDFVFAVSEDAWVNKDNPGVNYGANSYLTVKDRGAEAEAYLKFDQAAIQSQLQGKTVDNASLFLYQYQGTYSPGDTVNVYGVQGDWQEDSLTWDAKPQLSQAPLSAQELNSEINLWRRWQGLEGVVGNWATGEENFCSLAIENYRDGVKEELYSRFYSSEASDPLLRPYLLVSASATQGPTVTPEPASLALFLSGGAALLVGSLRRRRGAVFGYR